VSDDERRIKTGRRVICYQHGPYKGKRGRVVDVLAGGEAVQVTFGESSITTKPSYLEPV
jgi:ribosomal protein L24